MTTKRQHAEPIFAAAMEIFDATERRVYLNRACAGDPGLRQEVESLLAAVERAGTFLEAPAADAGEVLREAQQSAGVPLTEKPGDRIGRYKLLEQIGEGGFGVVWMAEQEEPVRRRVALKIIKLGMDTKEVVARFEAERQALALMDHRNIAHVFDGGATDTGRPYFVMELVKGIAITKFCDERRMSMAGRLDLFMQVCHAVQHAHQKGVIHRDLKPSNILVTVQDDRPVPKVIDFGVAKATQARLTEKTLFTRFHQWIGTPAYMSPEQAGLGSLDVDTRSDVYALGVLLYELLTGRPPFDTQKLLAAGYDAVMRTVREVEPPKPSTRLSTLAGEELSAVAGQRGAEPSKLGALVRGDLDWIVMKALEKDRTRRYDTAASLALDVARHLRTEPVSAAAPSSGYRLKKFVRRNRVAVGTVMTIAVTLVVATGVSLRSVWVAQNALGTADAERDRANQARLAEAAQRTMAEANAEESRLRLVTLNTVQGVQLLDRGDWFGASLWFCDALSRAGTNAPAAAANRVRLGVSLAYAPRLVRLWFHSGPVNQASFSPDGRWVLTAGRDGVARIWDLAGDQPVGIAMRHAGPVLGAEFSPDGEYVVTTCEDRTARVWGAASGKPVSPPLVHRLPLRRALFSSDGRRVITASSREQFTWSGDGQLKLEVRNAQSGIQIWEALSGRELPGSCWRNTNLNQLVASPANRQFAAAYPDGDVCLLDTRLSVNQRLGGWAGALPTSRMLGPVFQFGHSEEVAQPGFPGQDRPVWVPGHVGPINGIAFSPDEKQLATAGGDGAVLLWSLPRSEQPRTLRATRDLPTGAGSEVMLIAFSPEGQRLLALSKDGTVEFWRVPSGEAAGQLASPITGASSVVFSPDGRQVAVRREAAGGAGEVRIWDAASGQAVSPTLPHAGAVTSVCFNPDGSLLLTASLDGSVRVWNLATGVPSVPPLLDLQRTRPLTGSSGFQEPLVTFFSPDGNRVATLERGAVARLWDTATGQPITPVIEHGQPMPTAAFSHDGKRMAIGSFGNGQARVYDTATGQPLSPVIMHGDPVHRVAFSPDDRWLVTSGETGVRLWEATSGMPAPLPVKGIQAARNLVWSPDGRWTATCTGSSTAVPDLKANWQVQVWRAETGELAMPAREIKGARPEFLFSPDGRWLAVSHAIAGKAITTDALGSTTPVEILAVPAGTAANQSLELQEPVSGMRFSADSQRLFMLEGFPAKLRVWDVIRAETIPVQQPRDPEYRLREVGLAGRWLLSSDQGGWRLWETASGEPLAPGLGTGWSDALQFHGEGILPGGRAVLAGNAAAPQLWPITPDQRPLEEIIRHVQLLAARELDGSGNLATLAPAQLSNLWHTVRGTIPEAFSVGTNQVALWHLHEALQSEEARQWSGAELHLNRLLNTACDGPNLRQRLAQARTQAALEILKQSP